MVFIGYEVGTKGYKCYDPEAGIVYISVEMLYLKKKANGIGEIQTWKRRKILFVLQISLTQMMDIYISISTSCHTLTSRFMFRH